MVDIHVEIKWVSDTVLVEVCEAATLCDRQGIFEAFVRAGRGFRKVNTLLGV